MKGPIVAFTPPTPVPIITNAIISPGSPAPCSSAASMDVVIKMIKPTMYMLPRLDQYGQKLHGSFS